MKVFDNIRKALQYSLTGGQALHVWSPTVIYSDAPRCFKRCKVWAHLFDNDVKRLTETAKNLGISCISIERQGKIGQHIDLCGKPLEKALDTIDKEINFT